MKYTGRRDGIKYISEPGTKRHTEKEYRYEDDEEWSVDDEPSPFSAPENEKLQKVLRIVQLVLLCLQAALSVSLVIVVLILGMLPSKYVLLIVGALAVILGVLTALFFIFKTKKRAKIICSIISLVMCIVLAFGNYYLIKTNTLIEKVSGEHVSTGTYDVVVLVSDPAQDIADAADYTFGTNPSFNLEVYDTLIEQINEAAGTEVRTKEFFSVTEQVNALYDGDVDAIVYEQSFTDTITESNENYESEVKVLASFSVVNAKVEANDVDVVSEPFIVYVSGNDQWGEIKLGGRSDVNMLVCVNPNTQQILMVSIPRDYYVPLQGVGTGNTMDKLTHSGVYGMGVQIATIEYLLECGINYFAEVNFTSFIQIIDAIGGVTVNNAYTFQTDTDENGNSLTFEEGVLTLSGAEALRYCRERHHLPDGDFGRGKHQQDVIEGVINKVTSASAITYLSALLDALENCCITNMPKEKMGEFVQMQLDENIKWDIRRIQTLGTSTYAPSYATGGEFRAVVAPYEFSVKQTINVIKKIMDGGIITAEDLATDEEALALEYQREAEGYYTFSSATYDYQSAAEQPTAASQRQDSTVSSGSETETAAQQNNTQQGSSQQNNSQQNNSQQNNSQTQTEETAGGSETETTAEEVTAATENDDLSDETDPAGDITDDTAAADDNTDAAAGSGDDPEADDGGSGADED